MPAGHPVKKRTTKSYQRDVEHMTRLKSAIRLDTEFSVQEVDNACQALDRAIKAVSGLARKTTERERLLTGT